MPYPQFGQATTDFFLEISKGNVPGHSWQPVLTRINSTVGGGVIEDWRPTGGESNILTVTTAETWEIVSDSANDTSAGTGGRTVAIDSLDENYNEQTTIVTLNGTTPVTISGTHIRPRAATVITAGSSLVNEGNITVRKAGEVTNPFVRNYIVATQSLSKDPSFTVPAGKTAFIKQTTIFTPKNQDGIARNKLKAFGTDTSLLIGLDIPFYQNAIVFPVQGPFQLGEKLDIIFQVSTANAGVELQSIVDFIVIDNAYIGS